MDDTDKILNDLRNKIIGSCAAFVEAHTDAQTIRIMAGEMTAQEMRTVKAVLGGVAAKMRALQQKD